MQKKIESGNKENKLLWVKKKREKEKMSEKKERKWNNGRKSLRVPWKESIHSFIFLIFPLISIYIKKKTKTKKKIEIVYITH